MFDEAIEYVNQLQVQVQVIFSFNCDCCNVDRFM